MKAMCAAKDGLVGETMRSLKRVTIEQPRWATAVAELFPPQGEWCEEDYFALPDTNRIVELSAGELIIPPMPTDTHQAVLDMLYAFMRAFVRAHRLGIIRFSALPVHLWRGKIREPDILFVTHAHADRVHEQYWDAPDLAVEIISPSSKATDREMKFKEYARAGVREYWLVDIEAQTIEVFTLRGRKYSLLGKFGMGERARSKLLMGFEVAVDEVFAKE